MMKGWCDSNPNTQEDWNSHVCLGLQSDSSLNHRKSYLKIEIKTNQTNKKNLGRHTDGLVDKKVTLIAKQDPLGK